MKKTILIALLCVAFGSASLSAQNNNESKTKHLTYKEFIKNIWAFEKSPNTFQYKGKLPAVIDFYADWCGPCRRVAPIMEKLAMEYDGRLEVYKINVDQEKKLAATFGIQSIPCVLFIPVEGQPMKQVGALSEQDYKRIVEQNLLK